MILRYPYKWMELSLSGALLRKGMSDPKEPGISISQCMILGILGTDRIIGFIFMIIKEIKISSG